MLLLQFCPALSEEIVAVYNERVRWVETWKYSWNVKWMEPRNWMLRILRRIVIPSKEPIKVKLLLFYTSPQSVLYTARFKYRIFPSQGSYPFSPFFQDSQARILFYLASGYVNNDFALWISFTCCTTHNWHGKNHLAEVELEDLQDFQDL